MVGNSLPASALTRRTFSAGLLTTGLLAGSGRGLAQGTPKRGGTVRLALFQQSTGDTFDSARYDKGNDYIRGTSVYSYLTRMDEKGEAQPEVAESWEANKEATRWVFTIRKSVTFSDGAPLTTDDIIFSILRHREDKVASTAKQLIANIRSVTADGPGKVVFELAQPDVDFPILSASSSSRWSRTAPMISPSRSAPAPSQSRSFSLASAPCSFAIRTSGNRASPISTSSRCSRSPMRRRAPMRCSRAMST
jgi:ABC-type transport system substrate-binding protein